MIAIYPGTFDPMTLGHEDMVRRAALLFENLIVAVAAGHHKNTLFSLQERIDMAHKAVGAHPGVKVEGFAGLIHDFVTRRGVKVMVRGLRGVTDFDEELQLAGINRTLMPDVETIFMTPDTKYQFVSSSLVRQIAMLGGHVTPFVSPEICHQLLQKVQGCDQ